MILVVGYGNTLRRDDGAGPALADMLSASVVRSNVRVVTVHQLAPEIAELMAAPDISAVVFMDADAADISQETEDRKVRIHPVSCGNSVSTFGHHCSPSVIMTYAKLLYRVHPPAWLVSIPGFDFGYGEGFSKNTEELLTSALAEVIELITVTISTDTMTLPAPAS